MKLVQKFLMSFFFVSMSFSQIVDVFISDWYIGWRGDGVYNNLVELYNPKEDTVNLADYLLEEPKMVQTGSQLILITLFALRVLYPLGKHLL